MDETIFPKVPYQEETVLIKDAQLSCDYLLSLNHQGEWFKEWGFEKGWGDTAERVKEKMRALSEALYWWAGSLCFGSSSCIEEELLSKELSKSVTPALDGKPDLIIGNYTDGNLVASLMASKLGVTMGTIAHALEKTKYEDSDIKWKDFESKYHFSCQITADLIAMNSADFIITSTYQNSGREKQKRFTTFSPAIEELLTKSKDDPEHWNMISIQGLQRINECYTWKIYAKKVLNMANIYSIWRHLNKDEKEAKRRYIQALYNLQFKKLANNLITKKDEAPTEDTKPKPKQQAIVRRSQSRLGRLFGSGA
ncbi:hypothetical protein Leryth_006394 [Lithospermum erythrorhizon]|nr:hypothetical protein Leryth_006394 [Lithospermum erythrorhizon]